MTSRTRSWWAAAPAAVTAGQVGVALALADVLAAHDAAAPRSCSGEACDAVLRGLLRFADGRLRGLEGNGRSCADCHMPTDEFQLAPAAADARFKLLQWRRRFDPRADDPLFRPIDAD